MINKILSDCEEYLKKLSDESGSLIFFDSALPESVVPEIKINHEPISKEADIPRPKKKIEEVTLVSEPIIEYKPIEIINDESWIKSQTIEELNAKICNCLKCPLGNTRQNFVFGTGNPDADIMVIGEAPGADEDAQGAPFVGRAGQLLTNILASINLKREEVFIANIIKCRPPGNRRPTSDEVANCEPYLIKQIELIKPKFILALGLTAADTLFKKSHKMGDTRGKLFNYSGIQTLITYHPAALLRNPAWKKSVWEDVLYLRKLYDEYLESNK